MDHISAVVRSIWKSFRVQRKSLRQVDTIDREYVDNLSSTALSMRDKVKSLKTVVAHVIDDKEFQSGAKLYFRDVLDNIELIVDSLDALLTRCEQLKQDHLQLLTNRRDRAIYTLTAVSAVFLPAQFLTGVYGMNFDHMPELHYTYSYLIFWVVVLVLFVAAFFWILD